MRASHQIHAGFWPNEHRFGDQFFGRYDLRKAGKPLVLSESVSKDYWFPTFYANSTCTIAIFHCDHQAAKNMMACTSMEPVKMQGGRSLVAFACYEYTDVYNIPPYNEIAMMIPVITDNRRQIPVLSMMLGDKLDNFGYYVFHMPVTSRENVLRGEKIWGLPKRLENIDIDKTPDMVKVSASVADESPYFQLVVPLEGKTRHFDVKSTIYSLHQDNRLASRSAFIGDFIFKQNVRNLIKADYQSSPSIILGQGMIADKLSQLKIESVPFQTRFCDDFNACFDLPMACQPRRGNGGDHPADPV